ncbi:MAG: ABC transporter permease [Desulfobacterales bacterium]
MMPPVLGPFPAAAFRELKRRPLESVLLIAALLLTIAAAAFPLVLSQATTTATGRMLKDAPSLVVRRYDAVGWTPLPGDSSAALAESVAGVVSARPRIWGRVAGPAGPLTVVGIDPTLPDGLPSSPILRRGEAMAGADVAWDRAQPFLPLAGRKAVTFKVVGRLETQADIAGPMVVGLHIDDARELLAIPPGYASDLAVEVFNPAEETAILPDLSGAFPWAVRITTRTQTAGIHAAALARMSAMAVAFLVPALLATSLLVIVTVRERFGRRFEIGLLKALGWTTGDIVRLQLVRVLMIVVPAAAGGILLAFGLVFWPRANWFGWLCPEWQGLASRPFLTAGDAGLIILEVTGIVVLPFLAAALGTVLRCAIADPQELLERTSY